MDHVEEPELVDEPDIKVTSAGEPVIVDEPDIKVTSYDHDDDHQQQQQQQQQHSGAVSVVTGSLSLRNKTTRNHTNGDDGIAIEVRESTDYSKTQSPTSNNNNHSDILQEAKNLVWYPRSHEPGARRSVARKPDAGGGGEAAITTGGASLAVGASNNNSSSYPKNPTPVSTKKSQKNIPNQEKIPPLTTSTDRGPQKLAKLKNLVGGSTTTTTPGSVPTSTTRTTNRGQQKLAKFASINIITSTNNRGQQKLAKLHASTGKQPAVAYSASASPQECTNPEPPSNQNYETTSTGRRQVKMAKLAAVIGRQPNQNCATAPTGRRQVKMAKLAAVTGRQPIGGGYHLERIASNNRASMDCEPTTTTTERNSDSLGINRNYETGIETPNNIIERQRQSDIRALVPAPMNTSQSSGTDADGVSPGELEENQILSLTDPNAGLAVANLIQEDSVLNLPTGSLESHDIAAEEEARKARQQKTMLYLMGLVILGLLIVVAVILSAVYGGDNNNESSMPKPDIQFIETSTLPPSTQHPTEAPSPEPNRLIPILPEYSLVHLLDPFTPQYQAYNWVKNRKDFTTLPDWRMTQLFALACFYYENAGTTWPQGLDKNWLDEERSECDWYSSLYGKFYSHIDGMPYGEYEPGEYQVCNEEGHFVGLSKVGGDPYRQPFGRLPKELSLLTSLKYLKLHTHFENDSNVTFPDMFPPPLPNLQYMDMFLFQYQFENQIGKGTIPSQLGLFTGLKTLKLPLNAATGPIPSEIAKLTDLEDLRLSQNLLTGPIPELGTLTTLTTLQLHQNEITGGLPSQLGLLTSIIDLRLNDNSFTGPLPTEIMFLTNLETLWLHGNDFLEVANITRAGLTAHLTKLTDLRLQT